LTRNARRSTLFAAAKNRYFGEVTVGKVMRQSVVLAAAIFSSPVSADYVVNRVDYIDPATGGPHTAHTTNPVPFIAVSEDAQKFTLRANGSLQDISPTVLGMLGFTQPAEMTGHDLWSGDLRVIKSS